LQLLVFKQAVWNEGPFIYINGLSFHIACSNRSVA